MLEGLVCNPGMCVPLSETLSMDSVNCRRSDHKLQEAANLFFLLSKSSDECHLLHFKYLEPSGRQFRWSERVPALNNDGPLYLYLPSFKANYHTRHRKRTNSLSARVEGF